MTPFQTLTLICAIPFVVWAVVLVFDFFDTRARERRWQRALASFQWADTRTPLVEPPTTKPMLSLKGPTRL